MMLDFNEELEKIFGDKYLGCTQAGDELEEYRLKEGVEATVGELTQVDNLYQGARKEIGKLKAKVVEIDELKAEIRELKKPKET